MNTQSTVFAFGWLALAGVLVIGCGGGPEELSDASAEPDTRTLEQELKSIAGGGTSTGFICSDVGDRTKCICDPTSSDPVDSCDGMSDVCDAIGPGMLCDPFPPMNGWCYCYTWVKPKLSVVAPGGAVKVLP